MSDTDTTDAALRHKKPFSSFKAFCEILSKSELSVSKILAQNPQFPNERTLYRWKEKPKFAVLWKRAREAQAEHLIQKCLDLANGATPKNAHAIRVQFDIYRFFAAKVLPSLYGDKPSPMSVSTSVAVVISPERLNAIRAKLDASRATFKTIEEQKTKAELRKQRTLPESLLRHDREHKQSTATSRQRDAAREQPPIPAKREASIVTA